MPSERTAFDSTQSATEFRSLDGLRLRGTLVVPSSTSGPATVLVHGGGVTREEGGFFTRLARGLAESGVPSLRFDFRAHGASEGRQEELTISGVANDIQAAVAHAQEATGPGPVNLIGTSFGGGIGAFFVSQYPDQVRRLVLMNPLLDYKKRFIDDKPYWTDERISEEAGDELAARGFVAHSPSFKLGRALLNEVFYVKPDRALGEITVPTLFIHGTGDTFVPVASSRDAVDRINAENKLIEVESAQHGFAVHGDPQYREPQTREWQAFAIRTAVEWLTNT